MPKSIVFLLEMSEIMTFILLIPIVYSFNCLFVWEVGVVRAVADHDL